MLIGFILAFIVLLGNGIQPIVNNLRPSDFDALYFSMLVIGMELLMITPILLVKLPQIREATQKIPEESRKSIKLRLLLIGFIFAISTIIVTIGYTREDSVTGAIAVKTQPITMLLIGALFLHEKVTRTEVFFSSILMFLLFYLSTKGTFMISAAGDGIIYLLTAPILWNIGHSLAKTPLQKHNFPIMKIIFFRLLYSLSFLILIFFLVGDKSKLWQFQSIIHLRSAFYMASLYTVLHLTWYYAIKRIPLSLATSFIIPAPIVTVFFTFFVTHEPLYSYHYVGLLGSLFCLYGLLYFKNQKKNASK